MNIRCNGQLKYSGSWTGSTRWKSGAFVVTESNGEWLCELFINCNSAAPVRTYKLLPRTIDRIVSKGRLVLSMKNCDIVYFKPAGPSDEAKLEEAVQIINGIIRAKAGPLGGGPDVSVENETTPKKPSLSESPKQFTSMKENHRISQKSCPVEPQLFIDEFEEDSKENTFRGPGKKQEEQFFQRGQALKSIVTGDFYNSTPVGQRSYGHFATSGSGVKRPGLMPFNPQDQAKRPRLLSDKVSFSWQNRSINNQSKQTSTLQGFSNLGNTCYMNAILQSLLGLDPFSNDVLYTNRKIHRLLSPTSLYGALARLMNSRCKLTGNDLTRRDMLRNIKSAISSTARRFSGYQQHDAHEFLGQVLDQLKEEVTKITKATPSPNKDTKETEPKVFVNPTQDNFEFEVLHTITCFNCHEEVAKAERFNDLSVDLPQSSRRSIQDALDVFFKKEELEYTCGKCGHSKSEVTHKFTRLPRILILHVKRYTYDTQIARRNKTGQNMSICRFLTLVSHCDESTQPPPAMPFNHLQHLSPVKSLSADHVIDSGLRRRLDYNSGYKFKRIRTLSDKDSTKHDDNKDVIKQESFTDKETNNISETDDKCKSVDNSEDHNPKLAEAIELSLLQAQEKEKEYGEFDQDAADDELQKVLELSRLESEKITSVGHLEEKDLQKLTEQEQLDLALWNSLMEDSSTPIDNSVCCDGSFTESRTDQLEQGDKELNGEKICHRDASRKPVSDLIVISDSDLEGVKVKQSQTDHSEKGEAEEQNGTKVSRLDTSRTPCSDLIVISDSEFSDLESVNVKKVSRVSELRNSSNNCRKTSLNNLDDDLTMDDKCRKMSSETFVEEKNGCSTCDVNNSVDKDSDLPTLCNDSSVDLRCFEEKENILPSVEETSECDEFDVFGNSSLEAADDKSKEEESNEDGSMPVSYRLVSVVNHIGNSSFAGHYISDVYDMKKQNWFSYDDARVSRVDEADIRIKRQRTGYIFFYMLNDLFEEQLSINAAQSLISKRAS
ncbi:ubiquitin carboxyl-terminal hydrolase 37-like isoform X2 [Gigantopelta aegis]|uniref:ubiquitin carboxyl-terminal hydrolase 37-like isoform X2 n=1 Tax=Gigantopelta aegis TaxID=1735272 RepID=UPI001B887EAE|nr:ubiquitin carboxyl-terminal hydrolase 37-like isoform X2 [Gigantopelta aegis]